MRRCKLNNSIAKANHRKVEARATDRHDGLKSVSVACIAKTCTTRYPFVATPPPPPPPPAAAAAAAPPPPPLPAGYVKTSPNSTPSHRLLWISRTGESCFRWGWDGMASIGFSLNPNSLFLFRFHSLTLSLAPPHDLRFSSPPIHARLLLCIRDVLALFGKPSRRQTACSFVQRTPLI
ncbi:hypothetical protein MPTK2_1g24120 [Marchantia polymorpha subsp. ruderalis]